MALLVLTPDTRAEIREKSVYLPNQNVLFEFGFFYSALGPTRVALVRFGNVHLPEDLGGYIYIYGRKKFMSSEGNSGIPSWFASQRPRR